jgi:2,3-dihydroxyphenylpropionate 1,2-dioxygenase
MPSPVKVLTISRWACAAGALGERKPDIVSLEAELAPPAGSARWGGGPKPHYPIKPELVELTVALHGLARFRISRCMTFCD